MTPNQLRQKYLEFFQNRGHSVVPSSPIVPQNDPTTLFTGSGMQPMVPYLLGETHPQGTRIVDSQKCFRSQDIEEVGDNRHTTFFEMLGNWSLGDYFKAEQLPWVFSFLTDPDEGLGLDPQKLYVTVFSGDPKQNISIDEESVSIWKDIFKAQGIDAKLVKLVTEENGYKQGMQDGRIFAYEDKKNWWSRSGIPANMPPGEPGGPDSEIFYDFGTPHDKSYGEQCHPNCDCGRFLEIGNSVFMQFKKEADGSLKELPSKNVDFGGGLERIMAAMHENPDVFKNPFFAPIIAHLEKLSGKSYDDIQLTASFRVIADHIKAAVMLAADGVVPDSKEQGYFSRRLIRRAVRHGKNLGLNQPFLHKLVADVATLYARAYPEVKKQESQIQEIIKEEETKFHQTLNKGLKEFKKLATGKKIDAEQAFYLYETFGFPLELTLEEADNQRLSYSKEMTEQFETAKKAHADKSRSASAGMFKGGLADHSEATTKLHTATHLLHKALRNHLGDHVQQEGSHITADRLRFDFRHSEKLTDEQIKAIETEINVQIQDDLPVVKTIEDKDDALESGAMAFFKEKYPDKVSVYTIGKRENFYSKEFCGGPHVSSTGEIGTVTIVKQESIGSGKRRIYAKLTS